MSLYINEIKTSLLYFKVGKYSNKAETENDLTSLPRPFCSLGLIFKGNAIFQTKDLNVEVKEGEMIFIPQNCLYKSKWLCYPESNLITLHFNYEKSDFLFNTRDYFLQNIKGFDFDFYKREFNYIYENNTKNDFSLCSVLSKFYNICFETFPKMKFQEKKQFSNNITIALSFIEKNYSLDFDIPTLAKKSFLSESRFYDLFKKETGYTPVDYKNFIRIKHAIELIGIKNYNIEEITTKLGYNSSSYFRKIFKKMTNKNIKEFNISSYTQGLKAFINVLNC